MNINDNVDFTKEFDKLKLDPRMVGITAVNSTCNHNSASRNIMFTSQHFPQCTVMLFGEESIMQSGLERELGKHLFDKKLENDSKIISIIPRYRGGIDFNSINHTVDAIVIFQDLKTNEISYLDLPYNSKLHKYFGYKFKWNTEILNRLSVNDVLPGGTVLATSPSVGTNGGYKYGVNMNMCLMSMNETAEDGVVISKSAAKKLTTEIFEKRTVEFGTESFLLNLYGNDETYKPFPEIGEKIHESGLICALRKFDDKLAPALTSIRDIQSFDNMFDEVTYVRPGEGTVVDIKVLHTPKAKKELYSNTDHMVSKYANAYILYMQDILNVYNEILAENKRKYGTEDVKVSPKLTRLLVDAMALTDSMDQYSDKNIKKLYRNDPCDIYRIEFTISFKISPYSKNEAIDKNNKSNSSNIGIKISDTNGNKGIVVDVWDDERMPVDILGNRADIIQDPASTISRMNIGRLYEQYISQASRQLKQYITNAIIELDDIDDLSSTIDSLHENKVNELFNEIRDLVKLIGSKQYIYYSKVKDIKLKKDILKEVVNEELYIYHSIDNEIPAYKIVENIQNSRFKVVIDKVTFKDVNGEKVTSKENILIGPMYTIMLAKIADTWLSTSSAKVNHFGLPTSISKAEKYRLPWRNSGTKILSETETRLYAAYADIELLAELKDMGTSIIAHENAYMNILDAFQPTNIDRVVDRVKIPYGIDKARETVDALMNAAGVKMSYKKDDKIYH